MKTKTYTEIANQVGVSVTYIHYLVNTKKRPNWKRAKQIAEVTGTDPVLWLEGTPSEIKQALSKNQEAA